MLVLDGSRLARERTPRLAAKAQEVLRRRGRPPSLLLLAFGDDGHAAHVNRKLAAAAAVGVSVVPLILPTSTTTEAAAGALRRTMQQAAPDAVFLQVPFPPHVSELELAREIPAASDVDTMNPAVADRYFEIGDVPPPVTVTAALLLFDAFAVSIAGTMGVVIADLSPFSRMFCEALLRHGAHSVALVPPDSSDLNRHLEQASLVVVSVGKPGVLDAARIAPGSIIVDVGYFNPGGRGDVDTRQGTEHLAALSPVPGGIGPMTVSALLERTIEFALPDP